MLLFLELTNKGEAITISTSIKLPVGIENFEEIRTGGYYYEYYGAAEPPVRCGEILPQLSVFAFLYYRTYSIINISKNMGEAVRCQVHTVHYV